jgi:pimeloyl-ACP methyl ester carboxylesterase
MTTIDLPDFHPAAIVGTYWRWRGEKIYYVRSGEARAGRSPLLLIHGFGASTDHWRKNIDELSRDFEVWAIDLAGFGRSSKALWQYTTDLWVEQLTEFIETVIGQPVIIVGNSLGGYVSLCVAASDRNLATGLILLNSAGPFTDSTHPRQPNLIQSTIAQVATGILKHPLGNLLLFRFIQRKSFIRNTLKKLYLDDTAVTDRLVEEIYRPSCEDGATEVFLSMFSNPQSGEKVDVLLSRLSCPLLMLWGEGDPWINVRQRGEKFRTYYPNLQEEYLRAGHCPHDEIPTVVNQSICDWAIKHVCK